MADDPSRMVCPSDETLAAFIEGRCEGDHLAAVESHVATCATCLDVVAALLSPAIADAPVAESDGARRPLATPPPHRAASSRRWQRWAMAAVLVLALGGLLLVALRRPIGTRLTPTLARALGIPIDAKAFNVRLAGGASTFVVTLGQISIGHGSETVIRADEVAVTVGLSSLLSADSPITSVHVSRPEVNLAAHGPMALLASKSERAAVMGLLGGGARVEVEDARVILAGPSGVPLVVDGVTGGLERTADGANVALVGRMAGGTIDLVGTLGNDGRDLAITISGRGLDAGALPLLGERLRGLLDLRLDLGNDGRAIRADGRIAVRNGRLIGRGPGTLVRLSAPSRAALAAQAPALAADDLAFDDARAVFKWRRDSWRFPRVFLQSHGVIAGGRGRMSAHGEMSGRGTIRLPPAVVDAIQPYEPLLASFHDPNGTATLPFTVTGSWEDPRLALGPP